mmetsp:Transcript_1987/g.7081  ORF Transcript_1987/g.7081 Transcript_1987/m.7081 type:complete len:266 (-) Transcript_1987:263-1060(-)
MGCVSSVHAQAADLDRRLVQEGKLKISPEGQLSRRSSIASRSSRSKRGPRSERDSRSVRDSRSEPSPPPPSPPPQRAERDSRSERSERDSSDAGIALGLDLAERNDYTSLGYTDKHLAEADLPLHLRLALTRSRPATSGMSSGSLSRTASSGGSSSPRSPRLSEGSHERRLRRLSFGQDLSSETAQRDAAREARVSEQVLLDLLLREAARGPSSSDAGPVASPAPFDAASSSDESSLPTRMKEAARQLREDDRRRKRMLVGVPEA